MRGACDLFSSHEFAYFLKSALLKRDLRTFSLLGFS